MEINIKKAALIFAIIICAFFVFQILAIIIKGEEGRLKRTIYQCKRLTEKENILGLSRYISLDYHDEFGNDKGSLLIIARDFFREYRNIMIRIQELKIKIKEENATVRVEAVVFCQENTSEEVVYDTVQAEAKFRKEQNRWMLIKMKFFEPEKKRIFKPLLA